MKRPTATNQGFTLLELAVAMAVSALVLLGIYNMYELQQNTFRNQTMVVDTQQNLRGAMTLIQRDLMIAGYDRNDTGDFGIQIYRQNGNAGIRFTGDFGEGTEGDNGILGAGETIDYALCDFETDGTMDLCRLVDGVENLMAPDMEAMEIAYAYDNDGDGELETYNDQVIWAIDSDDDGDLDRILDDNGDGVIDLGDTPGGVSLGGLSLDDDIPIVNVRAVKIWLLARTQSPVRSDGFVDSQTYVVAGRRITPNDKFQRRLLTSTIRLRNLGI